ncbi:MAG: hypothetical protein WC222_00275 [Parachlamydiales bacterium]|jgi:cell division protein FtsL
MKDVFRFFIVMGTLSLFIFLYIREQNEILLLRRTIPLLEKNIRELEEDNLALEYEIDKDRSPENLLKKARLPAYGHLRFPEKNEVISIPQSKL